MKAITEHWWKVLCGLFLLYVLIAGMGAPLSPGVSNVEPQSLVAGEEEEVRITGYNTHFEEKEKVQLWLKQKGERLCPESFGIHGKEELTARFRVPSEWADAPADLYISDPTDGSFLLPEAFSIQEGQGEDRFEAGDCEPNSWREALSFTFPFRKILYESIRNLYFHVPMWFGMMGLMFFSFFYSIRHLRNGKIDADLSAITFARVGLLFAFLGLATGSLWARFTWGDWWVSDPKLNGAAATTLIYLAYLVLRNSIREPELRGRVAAVYNIFAFVLLFVFLLILPRVAGESLHPGSGGNPAFSRYDLDDTMRLVFYPAVLGWFLLGFWIARLRIRMERVRRELSN